MAKARRPLVVQVLAAAACVLSMIAAPALAYDWLQFGWNPQHSGNNTAESILTQANVSTLVQQYQVTLPSIADGAPVYLEGVTTPGGVKNLLFVTTRNALIIALDAQTGSTVWSHQYNAAGCQINGSGGACYTTSSPAIDPNRQYVYSYGLDGMVHKLQVGDGTEITTGGWPQRATFKGYRRKRFFGACDCDVGRRELLVRRALRLSGRPGRLSRTRDRDQSCEPAHRTSSTRHAAIRRSTCSISAVA